MHNLFLGTAKHMLKEVWLPRGISRKQFEDIQARVDSVVVPADIGRIPKKINSFFSSFTADKWKTWTIMYSLFALRDILLIEHCRCWESFVLACRLLCFTIISQDARKSDLLFVHFCQQTEHLYGKHIITPNQHLHCLLVECIKDYGPIYSFKWVLAGSLHLPRHHHHQLPGE